MNHAQDFFMLPMWWLWTLADLMGGIFFTMPLSQIAWIMVVGLPCCPAILNGFDLELITPQLQLLSTPTSQWKTTSYFKLKWCQGWMGARSDLTDWVRGTIACHSLVKLLNGNSRLLKWRYCTIWYKAIFCGDIHLHRPYYIGHIYGRYLHFRILKFPLSFWFSNFGGWGIIMPVTTTIVGC